MGTCDLTVRGVDFDVDKYLKGSTLEPSKVFHRGEPTGSNLRPTTSCSGFRIDICKSDEDQLDVQISKATEFLQAHGEDLKELARIDSGTVEVELAVGLFWLSDTVCYSITLPPSFLLFAGQYGVVVTLNVYATSEPASSI